MKRALSVVALLLIAALFALPILWLVTAPFNEKPTLGLQLAKPTLRNFEGVFTNPTAVSGLRTPTAGGSRMLIATPVATMALCVLPGIVSGPAYYLTSLYFSPLYLACRPWFRSTF